MPRKMTKDEITFILPTIITHKKYGTGEFEIIKEEENQIGVCYRHPDKTSSFGVWESSWEKVFVKLSDKLIRRGYMDSQLSLRM